MIEIGLDFPEPLPAGTTAIALTAQICSKAKDADLGNDFSGAVGQRGGRFGTWHGVTFRFHDNDDPSAQGAAFAAVRRFIGQEFPEILPALFPPGMALTFRSDE